MTDEQKPKLEIIGSPREGRGGSGSGYHYWLRFHECARRGTLSDVNEEARLNGDGDVVPYGGVLDAADTGAILHRLAEWWHTGTLRWEPNASSETGGPPSAGGGRFVLPPNVAMSVDNPNVEEAWRIFRWYAYHTPADCFGEVVGAEIPFRFADGDTYSPVGITPFTGRIDLAVRVSEERAEAITKHIMQPVRAGTYLLDHKSKGSKPSNAELLGFTESIQFHAYMMAWDVLFANKYGKCEGTIANFIVRHKTEAKLRDGESFSQHLVPFPTQDQQRATRHWFQTALRRKQEEGEMHADASFCEDWGRFCGHYLSGACKRY